MPKLGLLPNSGKFEFESFLQAFEFGSFLQAFYSTNLPNSGLVSGVERIVVSSVRTWQSEAGVCKRFRRHLCRLDYLTGTINEDHRMLLDDAAWIGATRRTSSYVIEE